MTTVKITTNNQPRLLLDFNQLTASEQEQVCSTYGQNVLDDDFPTDFIRYRGKFCIIDSFIAVQLLGKPGFDGWDGYLGDSFTTGVLVRFVKSDPDRVVMAHFSS